MNPEIKLKNEDIVCFAGQDWWYHNPHSDLHIMKSFAQDNRVLFINSIGIRMPSFKTDHFAWKRIGNKLGSLRRYLKKAEPNIYVLTPIALPPIGNWERFIAIINKYLLIIQVRIVAKVLRFKEPILWVSLPTARDVVIYLRKTIGKCLVYYCVDNISHLPGANQKYIYDLDVSIHKEADLALFVSHDLLAERKQFNRHTYHISHGVDFDHFAKVGSIPLSIPDDIKNIKQPIAGNVGVINEIDLELVKYLATRNKHISFVFVGDIYMDISAIKSIENVYFLGKRPYAVLPNYLQAFSCCCLFYQIRNIFIQYSNPKKLMEYLATGKPIVSVAIPEIKLFNGLVHIAENYADYEKYLRQAIYDDSSDQKTKRIEYASRQTWDHVASRTSEYIGQCLSSRSGPS